jgi:hypothetical protein
MYLERVPHIWLDEGERRHGVQLIQYKSDTPFDDWQRGRVFNAEQELKWEQRQQQFHVVYCGQQPPQGLMPVSLDAASQQTQAYYLWGARVREADRELLGLDTATPAFVELQIPRILHYPVAPQQDRVRVQVCEFYAADGQLCYARWYGLQ